MNLVESQECGTAFLFAMSTARSPKMTLADNPLHLEIQ